MRNINTKSMELEALQAMLLYICNTLNRPIRKSQLIKMMTDLFECGTPKQIGFALLDLVERNSILQRKHFIITPDFASAWDGNVTAADEGIIKFLLSLKEEAKHDLFFNVYAEEPLPPRLFFKYVEMKYPALLHREDTALAYMRYLENTCPDSLSNTFFAEKNDYPVTSWFTSFFNDPNCRIVIKNISIHKKHVNILLALLPDRSYKKANKDYDAFMENITSYFNNDMQIHVRKSMAALANGRKNKRR